MHELFDKEDSEDNRRFLEYERTEWLPEEKAKLKKPFHPKWFDTIIDELVTTAV
jgi:hypothetical protein